MTAAADAPPTLTLTPIGVARTPFRERVAAPRQPGVAGTARGTIDLYPGRDFEHALADLDAWEFIWVVFWFHANEGWRPKVLPPRSAGKRRGVFSTRSPHRPNPIGLSLVRLVGVDGLSVHVDDVDLLDGTPVLDLKPYVPYADARPTTSTGWLGAPADPEPAHDVVWSARAAACAAWIGAALGVPWQSEVARLLSLGPQPHPYRRIRRVDGGGLELAFKAWRVRFVVDGRTVRVDDVTTGYRPRELALAPETAGASETEGATATDDRAERAEIAIHRAFVAESARFGR